MFFTHSEKSGFRGPSPNHLLLKKGFFNHDTPNVVIKHIAFKAGGESSRPKLSPISHNVFRTHSSTELLTNNQHPVDQQHHVMFHSYREQQVDSAICEDMKLQQLTGVYKDDVLQTRMWVNGSGLIRVKELLPSLSTVSDQRALTHSHLTQVRWNVPSSLESSSAADGAAWNKTGLLWRQSEWHVLKGGAIEGVRWRG